MGAWDTPPQWVSAAYLYGRGPCLLGAALPAVGASADLRRMGAGTLGLHVRLGKLPLLLRAPGPGGLPSPSDHRFFADEDDVHRCGRCQAEFTALEDFVQHKLQKACQRATQEASPAAPAAGALLGQEVSPHPPPRPCTHLCMCVLPPGVP